MEFELKAAAEKYLATNEPSFYNNMDPTQWNNFYEFKIASGVMSLIRFISNLFRLIQIRLYRFLSFSYLLYFYIIVFLLHYFDLFLFIVSFLYYLYFLTLIICYFYFDFLIYLFSCFFYFFITIIFILFLYNSLFIMPNYIDVFRANSNCFYFLRYFIICIASQ